MSDGNHFGCRTCNTDSWKLVHTRCLLWTCKHCDGKLLRVFHLQTQNKVVLLHFICASRIVTTLKRSSICYSTGAPKPGICSRTRVHGGRKLLCARSHCVLLFPAYFNIRATWHTDSIINTWICTATFLTETCLPLPKLFVPFGSFFDSFQMLVRNKLSKYLLEMCEWITSSELSWCFSSFP